MKTKKRGLVILMCAIVVLSLGLFACSGSSEDAKKAFIGTWKLSGLVEDGEAVSQDDLEMMEAMGMTVTMTVSEDGNFNIDIFGESEEGTWEAKSTTEATFTIQGDAAPATLKDGTLTLEESGTQLSFVKDDSESSSKS